jgi:YHS domain-containing protein
MNKRDPVCGMVVDTESAVAHSSFLEADYFFCSTACQRTFETRPEQFLSESQSLGDDASAVQAKVHNDPPFTEAGGIVSPMFGSAGSGGAEYERIRKEPDR